MKSNGRGDRRLGGRIWALCAGVGFVIAGVASATIPTTLRDFFLPGSQPGVLHNYIAASDKCQGCHGNFSLATEPYRPFQATLMAQAARDPVFHAALAIANQDAAFAGDLCLRCHTPGGWISGRSTPTNGSALEYPDFDGVSCNFCHRMVDPINRPGNPVEDREILRNIHPFPPNPHSGTYIVDPIDRRRGPRVLDPFFPAHEWLHSPFHETSQMCATCHDVSNPAFTKQPDGSYALGPLDTPHPDGDKTKMFPVERTYSEWSKSLFAQGPVDVGGRFGGVLPAVSTCQDCHMPPAPGRSCFFGEERTDIRPHFFNGGNTWVLKAVRALYPDIETDLSAATVADSIARAVDMLKKASDMQVTLVAPDRLRVRVTNYSGHKLPTGYPEGRRMWLNVRCYNGNADLVYEYGQYEANTAVLHGYNTKVYEAKIGVDAAVSAATGVPVGPSFHFALNNVWYKDNRIPPMGFTNAGFAEVQSAPVAATYADGQHWDDTEFTIVPGTASVEVRLFYQTTSKEYIEFLRDANTTNAAGQIAYDQWVAQGKSAPVEMDLVSLGVPCYANCDGSVLPPVLNVNDFSCFLNKYAAGDPYANCDGSTTPPTLNVADFTCFLSAFAAGCP